MQLAATQRPHPPPVPPRPSRQVVAEALKRSPRPPCPTRQAPPPPNTKPWGFDQNDQQQQQQQQQGCPGAGRTIIYESMKAERNDSPASTGTIQLYDKHQQQQQTYVPSERNENNNDDRRENLRERQHHQPILEQNDISMESVVVREKRGGGRGGGGGGGRGGRGAPIEDPRPEGQRLENRADFKDFKDQSNSQSRRSFGKIDVDSSGIKGIRTIDFEILDKEDNVLGMTKNPNRSNVSFEDERHSSPETKIPGIGSNNDIGFRGRSRIRPEKSLNMEKTMSKFDGRPTTVRKSPAANQEFIALSRKDSSSHESYNNSNNNNNNNNTKNQIKFQKFFRVKKILFYAI